MNLFRLFSFLIVLFLLLPTTYSYAQPVQGTNVISTSSSTPLRDYIELPGVHWGKAEPGWIYHLVCDMGDDGIDPPFLIFDNLGMPSDDDSLLASGRIGDGRFIIDSLAVPVIFYNVSPATVGKNVYFRIFASSEIEPDIYYQDTFLSESPLSENFLEPVSIPAFPATPEGEDSPLYPRGIFSDRLNTNLWHSDHVMVRLQEGVTFIDDVEGISANLLMTSTEGFFGTGIFRYDFTPQDWSYSSPSLDRYYAVSFDYIDSQAASDEFALSFTYSEQELVQQYGAGFDEANLRIYGYSPAESAWILLETVIDTDANSLSLDNIGPVAGRFTLAPDNLQALNDDNHEIITEYKLHPVWPNPFNPVTRVQVDLLADTRLELSVYNILGRKVAELASGNYSAGMKTFTFDGRELSSGVYFVKLNSPVFNSMVKTILIK